MPNVSVAKPIIRMACVIAVLLAGCGGGGSSQTSTPSSEPPAQAKPPSCQSASHPCI